MRVGRQRQPEVLVHETADVLRSAACSTKRSSNARLLCALLKQIKNLRGNPEAELYVPAAH